jgi:hypothetical protein
MNPNRCKDCQHWQRLIAIDKHAPVPTHGTCEHKMAFQYDVTELYSSQVVCDHSAESTALTDGITISVGALFGCVHWEVRKET